MLRQTNAPRQKDEGKGSGGPVPAVAIPAKPPKGRISEFPPLLQEGDGGDLRGMTFRSWTCVPGEKGKPPLLKGRDPLLSGSLHEEIGEDLVEETEEDEPLFPNAGSTRPRD